MLVSEARRLGREELFGWYRANQEAIGLQVLDLKWTDEWCPGFSDTAVEAIWNGLRIEGRSVARSRELALTKALVELSERIVFLEMSSRYSTTSGMAAHFEENAAAVLSALELIERDRFMSHYLCGIPPRQMSLCECESLFPGVGAVSEKLSSKGWRFVVGELRRVTGVRTVISAAFDLRGGSPRGVILGLGAKGSLSEALESAFLEMLNTVVPCVENPKILEPLDVSQLDSVPCWDLAEAQMRFGLTPLAAGRTWDFLAVDSPESKSVEDFVLQEQHVLESIECESLTLPERLSDLPICIVRASSDCLQPLFFGSVKPEKVNLKSLSSFSGREIEFDIVEKVPHAFG